jgi:hypothetical protein
MEKKSVLSQPDNNRQSGILPNTATWAMCNTSAGEFAEHSRTFNT